MLRTRRRWVVATFVLAIAAVAYIDRVNLSVSAPSLAKEFHVNAAVMGLLLSSFGWTHMLMNIPAGVIVDRFRTRIVYALALVLWSASSFFTVAASSLATLFGSRLLLGVGESPLTPSAVRTLDDWLPKAERGLGGSLFISGVAFGSAVGPPALAFLVSSYGWRSCFIATGVLSLLTAVVWYSWYRHPADSKRLSAAERQHITDGQEPARQAGRAPWGTIVKQRNIWAITGGYFCLLYILYTFISWVPSYLVEDRGMTTLKSGFATSIPWVCAFFVGLLGGRISDLALQRGMAPLKARKLVLVTGMIAALAIIGSAIATSASMAVVFLSISTCGIIFANGSVWAAVQDVTHSLNLSGSATGFVNTMGNIGAILGPIVTGTLAEATRSFAVPLVVAGAVALLGAAIWGFGLRAKPLNARAGRIPGSALTQEASTEV